MTASPPAPPGEGRFQISRSMVFPLLGGRSTWKQEHLLPIFVTLLVGLVLLVVPLPWPKLPVNGKPAPDEINEAWQVFTLLAVYIAFLVNYYVNQMCGNPRPGWLLAVTAIFTLLLLSSAFWNDWYYLFYNVIPGAQLENSPNMVANVAGLLFGTALCEEGFKALPLFGLALLGAGLGFLGRRTRGRPSGLLPASESELAFASRSTASSWAWLRGLDSLSRKRWGNICPRP